MKQIYFISSNTHKIREVEQILSAQFEKLGYEVVGYDLEGIKEIQSKDLEEIVRDKALKAYKKLRRPLFVEHTGLQIEQIGDLPGGLTQIFWTSMGYPFDAKKNPEAANKQSCENFSKYFPNKKTKAVTWVAYCDGRKIHTFEGSIQGTITDAPRGDSLFQWDPIFQPDGYDKTFAEIDPEEKNKISMRRRALECFADAFEAMDHEEVDGHIEEIKELIKENKLILFIGSGVPGTLELPTWGKLIETLAREREYDSKVFDLMGDFLALAEYYKVTNDEQSIKALCDWMKTNWNIGEGKLLDSDIYRAIVNLGCSVIYTTNYDHTLEDAFLATKKPYKRIVGVDDLASIGYNATQIVKFHGDMDDESSIVLAEQDYFKRLDFESHLDIKLRADMLGKSILFLGYSLSDINIRFLIYKLDQLWGTAGKTGERPKSYIFMAKPNPIQEKIFSERGIVPIVGQGTDRTASLKQFLEALSS